MKKTNPYNVLVSPFDDPDECDYDFEDVQKRYENTKEILTDKAGEMASSNKNGSLEELYIVENKNIDIDFPKNYISKTVSKYLSSLTTPPGVIGICKKIKGKEIGNRIIMLDGIQDPGNLGTIIRSSVAFNIDTIILGHDTVDVYNEKVIRASQGMIFSINVITCNLIEKVKELKDNGYKIISTDVTTGKNIKNIEKLK